MTMKVTLDFLTKETIDKYAGIECAEFGDILVKAMGINGTCSLFKHGENTNCYIIGWILENGVEYESRFDADTIMRSLWGKSLKLTMDVYSR